MKLQFQKDWFAKSAEIEGVSEVGAGLPPNWHALEPLAREAISVLDTRIAFGQFVELWRRNTGWNPERLACEAGIETEEVLEIEHDPHYEPEPDAIFKLARVFDVPAQKLLELAGLVTNRTPQLREEAIRFAARSESISALTEPEKEAFEAFVATLNTEKA